MLNLKALTLAVIVGVLSPVVSMNVLNVPQVLAQTQEERKAEADRLLEQGKQQGKTSQFREAIQSFQEALKIYREISYSSGAINATLGMGYAFLGLGETEKAIKILEVLLKTAQETNNSELEKLAQRGLQLAQRRRSRSQNHNNPRKVKADRLLQQGIQQFNTSQFREALQSWQQALEIYQEISDRHGEAKSLNNLGVAYDSLGQYQKAIKYFQQSLAIEQEISDRKGESSSLTGLGNAYRNLGQYQKTIEYHQQSLKIKREISDRNGEAKSLNNLGVAYASLGQYQKAIKYFQQSLTIVREIGDHNEQVVSLNNLGSAYNRLRQYQKGIKFFQQALGIAREISDRNGEAKSLNNLGNAYNGLGQYQKAIEYHQQSLEIKREISDYNGESASLGNLGNAYNRLGQYQKGIEFIQQSLAISRKIGDRHREADSLNNLGFYLLLTDKPVEAEVELRKAIDVYESLRTQLEQDSNKVSVFDIYLRSFRSLQKALVDQDKTDAALEISEQGRARSLAESISERLNNSQPDLISTVEAPNLQQIRQIAKTQNSTFVQYSIVRFRDADISSLYIWIVKPTGEITFKEVSLSSLNTPLSELVDNSRIEDIGARGRNGDGGFAVKPSPETLQEQQARQTANLRQLHDLLIQPIADLLPTDPTEKVVFMPQGELYLVPFPALIDQQNQYLIEKHTILTSPSIQLLDIARQSHNEKRNNPASEVLIVGNPTMPEVWHPETDEMRQLSALKGAEDEAFAIADKLQTKPLVWDQATEPIVTQKMQNARLIHLATHGLLEYGIPEESGVLDAPGAIALAPSADADGLLTSVEIYNMNLQAELVVLSACDTGRGKISGDGVIGLSRAFLQAGVPSLIVSLWKVPDESTQFLMTKFYDYWQEDMDKVTALRQAILDTKEKYPEPINWAAFTLVGEAQ